MSAPIIECFYTLSSPWMYFAAPRLRAMAERHGAKVRLRPFDFPEVVPSTGGIPLRTRPQPRQDYHALELDRWRRHLDMPLNLRPKHYPPAEQRPAGRMVMAAQAQGLDAQVLSQAILTALWVEERDIADPDERAAIADALGMPGQALVEAEESPVIRAEWRQNSEDAKARGVFGSPTFFLGDLWLWGQDRLFFLEAALRGEAVQTP
jgi:2-hydroxychromene-2-carboxylate isomerase